MNRLGNFEAEVQAYADLDLPGALRMHTALLRRGEYWIARLGLAETGDLLGTIRESLHELNPKIRGSQDIHVAPCIMGSLREPQASGVGIWCRGDNPAELAREAGATIFSRIFQSGEISAV